MRIWGFEFPGGGRLKVILTDEQGDTLQPIYEGFYGNWSGFILGPGEAYSEALDLTRIFYDHKTLLPLPFGDWSGRLAPGRYEVAAEYLHRFGGETIRTAAIPFRVVEPAGVEHQAFNLFLEAYRSWTLRNYHNTDELLAKLVADYPKSVYVDRAYRKFGKDQKLLEKMPDSGYLGTYLHWALKGMSDEGGKRSFLKDIIQKHPGTRVARFAEQRLQRLQRGE